jgi:hypothetical protein
MYYEGHYYVFFSISCDVLSFQQFISPIPRVWLKEKRGRHCPPLILSLGKRRVFTATLSQIKFLKDRNNLTLGGDKIYVLLKKKVR